MPLCREVKRVIGPWGWLRFTGERHAVAGGLLRPGPGSEGPCGPRSAAERDNWGRQDAGGVSADARRIERGSARRRRRPAFARTPHALHLAAEGARGPYRA